MHGLRESAAGRVVIIVDVLSFSTATTVAVSRGAEVLPCIWNDERAAEIAKAESAQVTSKRGAGPLSLAPASMMKITGGTRIVLPSPNGSTLAYTALELNAAAVAIGCIRNAGAAASWASKQPNDIVVIPAGERRGDGTIRFAIEDWLGAGAILSRLQRCTDEAEAAVAAFERMRHRLPDVLAACESGRELINIGYPDDVDLASQLDVDTAVPLLTGNAFKLASL